MCFIILEPLSCHHWKKSLQRPQPLSPVSVRQHELSARQIWFESNNRSSICGAIERQFNRWTRHCATAQITNEQQRRKIIEKVVLEWWQPEFGQHVALDTFEWSKKAKIASFRIIAAAFVARIVCWCSIEDWTASFPFAEQTFTPKEIIRFVVCLAGRFK